MGMDTSMMAAQGGLAFMQHKESQESAAWEESIRILNNKAAEDELVRQSSNVMDKAEGVRDQGIEELVSAQIAGAKAAGSASVQAGFAGTTGGSVDRVMYDINTQTERNTAKIVRNRDQELNSIYDQMDSHKAQALGRQDHIRKRGQSTLEGALSIGEAGYRGYKQGAKIQTTWDDYNASGDKSVFDIFG